MTGEGARQEGAKRAAIETEDDHAERFSGTERLRPRMSRRIRSLGIPHFVEYAAKLAHDNGERYRKLAHEIVNIVENSLMKL